MSDLHWVYQVLKEGDALLPCFFYDSPSEMFNLPLNTDFTVDARTVLTQGIMLDLIALRSASPLDKATSLDLVCRARYLRPKQRRDCAVIGLTERGKEWVSQSDALH
jgi:hypothetical protein